MRHKRFFLPIEECSRQPRTVEDFLAYLPAAESLAPGALYRGQGNAKWDLTPSIFRIDGETVSDKKLREHILELFQERMLAPFIETLRMGQDKFVDLGDSEFAECVSIGQHYGIPTPALDWTDSALVSFFMAIQFFDLKADRIRIFQVLRGIEQAPIEFYRPQSSSSRLINQKGVLSFVLEEKGATIGPGSLAPLTIQDLLKAEDCVRENLLAVDIELDMDSRSRYLKLLSRNRFSLIDLFPDSIHWKAQGIQNDFWSSLRILR